MLYCLYTPDLKYSFLYQNYLIGGFYRKHRLAEQHKMCCLSQDCFGLNSKLYQLLYYIVLIIYYGLCSFWMCTSTAVSWCTSRVNRGCKDVHSNHHFVAYVLCQHWMQRCPLQSPCRGVRLVSTLDAKMCTSTAVSWRTSCVKTGGKDVDSNHRVVEYVVCQHWMQRCALRPSCRGVRLV